MRRRFSILVAAAIAATGLTAVLFAPATAATSTAGDTLALLDASPTSVTGYNRDLFAHWSDADSDGCDTRSEVLQTESQVAVTFGSGCTVATGQWVSPFDGATWTQASDVDVDHMVPLSEAWSSGAHAWSASKREAFANDLAVPYALIAVTDNVNQSKSDSDPAAWLPPATAYRCQYVTDWVLLKYRWDLGVDPTERSAIQNQLNQCPATQVDLPERYAGASDGTSSVLYITKYDGAIHELDGAGGARHIDAARWQNVYNKQTPLPAPTDYVKYPWSNTVYAVTFWSNDSSKWLWRAVSLSEWQRAGSPAPRIAGWIAGSTYHRWATSSELFVRGADGVTHKLTYAQWQASGFKPFETRSNQGFQKLTWSPNIAHMRNIATGDGGPINYSMWAGEALPTPQQVQRFPGDTFYKDACNATVIYAGPTMNRAINYQEYVAAGQPAVRVDNPRTCAPPPSPNGPVAPISQNSCPSYAPIKGNASSMIYHVPGGSYYNATNPEACFRTEADAIAHGYRRSRA